MGSWMDTTYNTVRGAVVVQIPTNKGRRSNASVLNLVPGDAVGSAPRRCFDGLVCFRLPPSTSERGNNPGRHGDPANSHQIHTFFLQFRRCYTYATSATATHAPLAGFIDGIRSALKLPRRGVARQWCSYPRFGRRDDDAANSNFLREHRKLKLQACLIIFRGFDAGFTDGIEDSSPLDRPRCTLTRKYGGGTPVSNGVQEAVREQIACKLLTICGFLLRVGTPPRPVNGGILNRVTPPPTRVSSVARRSRKRELSAENVAGSAWLSAFRMPCT
ncbi:hypothetical protein C8R46DRAFT_1044618 [Mycena filopes]|nr:hypothetical protein C8R46DRAFT_1044618 [Mycena filopes]